MSYRCISLFLLMFLMLSAFSSCVQQNGSTETVATDEARTDLTSVDACMMPVVIGTLDEYASWLKEDGGLLEPKTNEEILHEYSATYDDISIIGDFRYLVYGFNFRYVIDAGNECILDVDIRMAKSYDKDPNNLFIRNWTVDCCGYSVCNHEPNEDMMYKIPLISSECITNGDLRTCNYSGIKSNESPYFGFFEVNGVRYLYGKSGNLLSVHFLIGEKYFEISPFVDSNIRLFDYPTDGEETFISRLLNADTVASAKAELEKCILGE